MSFKLKILKVLSIILIFCEILSLIGLAFLTRFSFDAIKLEDQTYTISLKPWE